MKHFHITLKLLIDSDMRNAADIARATGVSHTMISRICTGTDCSAEVMGQIAAAFPQPGHRLALLRTWLLDRAEEAHFAEADIAAAYGSAQGLHIPPELRAALEKLLPQADIRPDLVMLLNSLAGIISTTREPVLEVAEGPGPTNLPPPKTVSYANATASLTKARRGTPPRTDSKGAVS